MLGKQTQVEQLTTRPLWLVMILALIAMLSLSLSVSVLSILPALLTVWLLCSGQYYHKWQTLKQHPLFWLALSVYALVLIATLWGDAPSVDKINDLKKYAKLWYAVAFILIFDHKNMQRLGINCFLIGLCLMVSLSYLKYLGWLPWYNKPADSVIFNHIDGSFLVAIGAYFCAKRAFSSENKKYLHSLLFILLSFQLFFINGGRTGWLVYLVLMVLFIFQHCDKKERIALALLLAGSALLILYFTSATFQSKLVYGLQTLKTFHHDENTSLGWRIQFLHYSWHLFKETPWFGHGSGSFSYLYSQNGSQFISGWGTRLDNPHNSLVFFAVQYGLIGILLWIFFFASQWYFTYRLEEMRDYAQAVLLAMVAASFCDSMLRLAVCGSFYCLMIGLLFAKYNRTKPIKNQEVKFTPIENA